MLYFNDAPVWYLLFCGLTGFIAAWALYWRNPVFYANNGVPSRWRWVLPTLRFLTVFLLTALLLSPLLKTTRTRIEKPILVVGLDASKSMGLQPDSAKTREAFQNLVDQLTTDFSEQFTIEPVSIGKQVTPYDAKTGFTALGTNLGGWISTYIDKYDRKRLGAFVLVSDGLHNEGADPLSESGTQVAPIYTVGVGDTLQHKDLWIQKLRNNEVAYAGNSFPVVVQWAAKGFSGQHVPLRIFKNGKLLAERDITISSDDEYREIEIPFEAGEVGVQRLRFELGVLPDELTDKNNVQECYIEIIEGKQKLLVVGSSPHPDLGSLKRALSQSLHFDVTLKYLNEFTVTDLDGKQLVILHQIPSNLQRGQALWAQCEKRNLPCWLILGNTSSLLDFNSWQTGLQINGSYTNANEVFGNINESFRGFGIPNGLSDAMVQWPPLVTPYGQFSLRGNTDVLMYQQIGQVKTTNPLWVFSQKGNRRLSILAGEGLWRWRLAAQGNPVMAEALDALLVKTCKYLLTENDQNPLHVFTERKSYGPDETIHLDGFYYNASRELFNKPELFLELYNEQGQKTSFSFARTDQAYSLEIQALSPGVYTYKAKLTDEAQTYTSTGSFRVTNTFRELAQTRADFNMLRLMSQQSGGQFFTLMNYQKVADAIRANPSIKPILITEKHRILMAEWWPWLLIILCLAASEWFIRKYQGSI